MLDDTYEHTPAKKMFAGDYYGIGYDDERASRKKIKLGIIGTGGIAQSKHIPAINRLKTIWEQIQLVAFSVRNKYQGEKIADIYKYKWYSDYKEMIKNEKLDGVIISTPDKDHYEHTMYCLNAGINVLLEKPFTTLLSDGKELCEYADKKKLILYDSEEGPTKSWLPIITGSLMFDEELGGYMGLIENFAQVIRGNEPPLVTGWDGFKACEIAAASQLSMKESIAVKIPLDVKETDFELKKYLYFLK